MSLALHCSLPQSIWDWTDKQETLNTNSFAIIASLLTTNLLRVQSYTLPLHPSCQLILWKNGNIHGNGYCNILTIATKTKRKTNAKNNAENLHRKFIEIPKTNEIQV